MIVRFTLRDRDFFFLNRISAFDPVLKLVSEMIENNFILYPREKTAHCSS